MRVVKYLNAQQMETKKEIKESEPAEVDAVNVVAKNINSDDITKLQDSLRSNDIESILDEATKKEDKVTTVSKEKVPKPVKNVSKSVPSSESNMDADSNALFGIEDSDNEEEEESDDDKVDTSFSNVPISQPESSAAAVVIATDGTSRIRKKQKVDVDEEIMTPSSSALDSSITKRSRKIENLDDIFTTEGLLTHFDWSPSLSNNEPISFKLNDFKISTSITDENNGNQTIAMKLSVDPTKGRWSVNLSPDEHRDYADIMLHFNPRYGKNETLVMNDLQGTWGRPVKRSLIPNARQNSMILIIQIRAEGFYSFVNGVYFSFFAHRRDISTMQTLTLQVPALDGMGVPENLTLHKLWWGYLDEKVLPSVPKIPDDVVKSAYDNLWLRTVCVDGLPPETDPNEVYELEKALYALFNDYVPEAVSIVDGKGRAYVRIQSAEYVDQAIQELNQSVLADTFCLIMSPCL